MNILRPKTVKFHEICDGHTFKYKHKLYVKRGNDGFDLRDLVWIEFVLQTDVQEVTIELKVWYGESHKLVILDNSIKFGNIDIGNTFECDGYLCFKTTDMTAFNFDTKKHLSLDPNTTVRSVECQLSMT